MFYGLLMKISFMGFLSESTDSILSGEINLPKSVKISILPSMLYNVNTKPLFLHNTKPLFYMLVYMPVIVYQHFTGLC